MSARQAVGDESLTYHGFSYGTIIGATYANMYPKRVRAVILDGVIDPVSWSTLTQLPTPLRWQQVCA